MILADTDPTQSFGCTEKAKKLPLIKSIKFEYVANIKTQVTL